MTATLHEQLEQARILSEDTAGAPKQVVVDLGFRGVDAANPALRSSTGASSNA